MKKILFICHGNICRSPMAEFVMKDLVEKAGLSGQFDLVEWVLFDSHTESVYEAEVTLYYNIRI